MSGSLQPQGLYSPWNTLGQNTEVGSLSLLQGIFPTQGSNPGLPHCWQILYQLSHKPQVRSMNQGKMEPVKQEMARVNIDILGISEMDRNGQI